MQTTGIIAEYNPLHNGHEYHIRKAREITGCDAVVAAMSGDYVQRGEPAIMDKWTRAGLALRSGADLVIEIPALYCLGNAGQYASAGVRLLGSLGCTDALAFGSECGDIELLEEITDFITANRAELEKEINSLGRKGYNYPVAKSRAYESLRCYSAEQEQIKKELRVLESSNDILALEYIKAIKNMGPVQGHLMKPAAIKREGAGYSDPYDLRLDYQSASALRTQFFSGHDIGRYIPECTKDALMENHLTGPDRDMWFDLLRYAVMSSPAEMIEDCPSGGEGLANLMKAEIVNASSMTQFVRRVKSKRYTYTRISRLCMQLMLAVTRSVYDLPSETSAPGYIRVLGFTDTGRRLLAEIKKNDSACCPVLTNINKERQTLSGAARVLLDLDIHASDIYNLATGQSLKERSDHRMTPVYVKDDA